MTDELKGELLVLNLLRQVFLKEPGLEFLEGIGRVELPAEKEGEVGGLATMVNSVRENSSRLDPWVEALALEFARLFIGPVDPPAVPYASFYLSESHSLMTEETLEVRRRYLQAGLAVKDLHRIPDDHVAMEAEFLYDLTRRAIQSLEEGKGEEASALLALREDFLKQHMIRWVPLFSERVIQSSREDFFKGAAALLQEFIEANR